MTPESTTTASSALLTEAEEIMRENKIKALIVTGERCLPNGVCDVVEIFD